MKRTDDYTAKFDIWVEKPRVVPLPRFRGVPAFGHKKFSSYRQFNQWKRALLIEIARAGGLKWTK